MCNNPVYLNLKRELYENGDVHCFSAIAGKHTEYTIPVACGKCIECSQDYSKQWALRMLHEYEDCGQIGCFLTLTYEKTDGSLHVDDVQRFIKRLRKRIAPLKVRYFLCGEYGSKGLRPHYHLVLFGFRPSDMVIFREKDNLYTSSMIDEIWRSDQTMPSTRVPGFHSIGDITFDSLIYVAKYLQKLSKHPDGTVRPFTIMSRRPGIALSRLHHSDSGVFYIHGKKINEPRRYLERAAMSGIDVQPIIDDRVNRAKLLCRSSETLEASRNREKILIHKLST